MGHHLNKPASEVLQYEFIQTFSLWWRRFVSRWVSEHPFLLLLFGLWMFILIYNRISLGMQSNTRFNWITREAWQNHSEIPVHFEPAYIHLFHWFMNLTITLGLYIDQTWLFCNKIVIIVVSRSLTQKRFKHGKFCWKILATNQIVNNFRPVVSTIRSLIL